MGQDKDGSHLQDYNFQNNLGVKPKQMTNNPSRHTPSSSTHAHVCSYPLKWNLPGIPLLLESN